MKTKEQLNWVYLSPHYDDAVYSCGGLICSQVVAGDKVQIWTIFGGEPKVKRLSLYARSLHARWQTNASAALARRQEDLDACQWLGTKCRHFDWPDCIYRKYQRRWLVKGDVDLFAGATQVEKPLLAEIAAVIRAELPVCANLVLPLTVGNHIDHRLIRMAGELVSDDPFYYVDLPYGLRHPQETQTLTSQMRVAYQPKSSKKCFQAWMQAMASYHSQMNTFWHSSAEMAREVQAYLRGYGAVGLYKKTSFA